MTDQELIERLRVDEPACEEHFTANLAANRIEELVKERKAMAMRDAGYDVYAGLESKLAKAVEALKSLHHVVCGKNGFAAAVRNHSGKAYPWEPLDIADEQTRTVLAELNADIYKDNLTNRI